MWSVKSFSRKTKFTVVFRLFALVFISKELLRKGRILAKTCLARSKSLLSIFFQGAQEVMSFRIVRGVVQKVTQRQFNIQLAVGNWV